MRTMKNEWITASDGVRICADVYLPEGFLNFWSTDQLRAGATIGGGTAALRPGPAAPPPSSSA
ncbi:hypothetical protein ACFWA6_06390 [Streptomyces sp. NPDC060020]|uniref:hypothetical protein n=1 Tax=Streptomyces sp. NPDC060020 TaxID=3347038 RepID=UPI0036BC8D11